MTQDEIIRMARDAGMEFVTTNSYSTRHKDVTHLYQNMYGIEKMERFAALVAAHEREKQAEQEPVAWASEQICEGQFIEGRPRKMWWECKEGYGTPLYAAPVRTKDLTDDEIISALFADMDTDEDKAWFLEIARAVIAADREKNK